MNVLLVEKDVLVDTYSNILEVMQCRQHQRLLCHSLQYSQTCWQVIQLASDSL